jgi:hypothetical protein
VQGAQGICISKLSHTMALPIEEMISFFRVLELYATRFTVVKHILLLQIPEESFGSIEWFDNTTLVELKDGKATALYPASPEESPRTLKGYIPDVLNNKDTWMVRNVVHGSPPKMFTAAACTVTN